MCQTEKETIQPVLCRCPALKEERVRRFEGGVVTIDMMVTEPEKCRRTLMKRFKNLTFDPGGSQPKTQNTEGTRSEAGNQAPAQALPDGTGDLHASL